MSDISNIKVLRERLQNFNNQYELLDSQANLIYNQVNFIDMIIWHNMVACQTSQQKSIAQVQFLKKQAYLLYLQAQSIITKYESLIINQTLPSDSYFTIQAQTLNLQARDFELHAWSIENEASQDKSFNDSNIQSLYSKARTLELEAQTLRSQSQIIKLNTISIISRITNAETRNIKLEVKIDDLEQSGVKVDLEK